MHHAESIAANHRALPGQANARPVIKLSRNAGTGRDMPPIGGVPPMFTTQQPARSEGMPRQPVSG